MANPRYTLTDSERVAVIALKEVCETEGIAYSNLFELAKYVLVVQSSFPDSDEKAPQKRLEKAKSLLRKRNSWLKANDLETVDPMAALEDLYKACPKFFYTKYTHDKDGRVVVGHDQVHAPADYMYKSKENMTTFLAAEQLRMNMGAVDLEEARLGFCIVGILDGKGSASGAVRYIRMSTKSKENVKGMHPHRIRKIYCEVPSLYMYAARACMAILPKKIVERILLFSSLPALENHMQTKETIPNTNVLEWAKARQAKYLETLERLSL
ncbi:expressed unknown protein [Seminavis robusta]|uniref:CRAL-TRIO domain-containing protein n=1 Tax=Seminavis robusta TaxID=568900 RepID=A0A9N8E177_9STRA|nr:expressed unknown protein [Seminavis robusta]|eukprot:Sro516_g158590.1 n/a (268) ;mRNA; f:55852-56655